MKLVQDCIRRLSENPVLVLIGEKSAKRTIYMQRAALNLGIALNLVTWAQLRQGFDYS